MVSSFHWSVIAEMARYKASSIERGIMNAIIESPEG